MRSNYPFVFEEYVGVKPSQAFDKVFVSDLTCLGLTADELVQADRRRVSRTLRRAMTVHSCETHVKHSCDSRPHRERDLLP